MLIRFLAGIGASVRTGLERLTGVAAFTVHVFRALGGFYRRGFSSTFSVILRQIKFTGVDALPYVFLIALLLGSLVIIQAMPQLSMLGAGEMIGRILVITVIRELGPLITAVVVIARSGTAISAELGASVVLREIEALESMGINPFYYTYVPRIIASVIAVFCLTIYFDLVAIFGGYLIASTRLVLPFNLFLDYVMRAMNGSDLYLSTGKSLLFGGMIATLCCYFGLSVQRNPTEIPRAVTRGVVASLFTVFITSFVISYIAYK